MTGGRFDFDPGAVTALLAEASRTLIMPKFGRLADDEIRSKSSPADLVTEVDVTVEAFLRDRLRALAPDAVFVGEEAAAADPAIVAAVEGAGSAWILDPLDGTRNFVKGVREFATILAYVEDGRAVAGWIYACPDDFAATAVRGEGALIDGAPPPAGGPAAEPPQGMRSISWLAEEWRERLLANLQDGVVTRSGHCSAYAYLKLIRGEVDFKLSSRIHPWDHVAGALMLEEVGGAAAYIDKGAHGEPFMPADSADRPLLATAPGRDWRAIADILLNGPPASDVEMAEKDRDDADG
ncbi:MAG: inositol monophosphatase [Alphaproteobacteria bacterium]|nr:inositol monophosphatase [Alphaproteobacteria bacterium]